MALTSNSADAGGSGVASVVFERSPAGAGTWTATAASWNTASGPDAVTDGGYDVRVRTTDNAGNVFTSPAITVLVDHTAPTTSASLAPGTPSNAPVTVSFSASDGSGSGVSAISYRVDGGSLQLGAAVIVPAPGDHSNDGSHLVEFFATDEVGNVETLKSVTVVIDTTAPSGSGGDPGTYLRGIANLTYSTAAGDVSSVQFQFSPAGAGAWSNVGGADISPPYEAAWNTALVADGPYDLRAVVTDTTGNVATTLLPGLPKTVDNTAPAGSVTAPAGGAYVSGAVAVDASATDGAAPPASGVSAVRFEVKPAGAGAYSVFGTQTAPVFGSTYRQTLATTALADGLAELRVVVTDVAGNEATSALSTINVDNDAPVVTLDDPGAAVGASVGLTATSSADTTDVTFRYRPVGSGVAGTAIGSDSTAPFAVTWTTAPAAEQQWELIAVATDGGGNVTTSAPRTVLVDRTQPTGSVTAPVGRRQRRRACGRPGRDRVGHRRLGCGPRRVAGEGVRRRQLHHRCERRERSLRRNLGLDPGPRRRRRDPRPRHGRRRQHPHDRRGAGHGRLDRPGRDPRRPRCRSLGHGLAGRDDGRRRDPRPVRGQPGERRHVDADRRGHDGAVRGSVRHGRARRRPLRPARNRLRRPRQRVRGLDPGGRPARQHRPAARLGCARGRLGLGVREPDRADGLRARDRSGSAARRRRRTCARRRRQPAHLPDRLARGRAARALRRARGRQRHPHPVPGRGHDREHGRRRPAARSS